MPAVMPTLFAIAVGRWIDRVGTKSPALFGYSLCIVGVLAPVIYPEVIALWITATLVGGGWTFAQTAQQNATGRLSTPEHRTRDFTTVSLAVSVSSFSGPILAGFAVDGIGYRAAFALVAVFPLAAAITIGLFHGLPASTRATETKAPHASLLDLIRAPGLREMLFITVITSVAWDAHTFLVPVFGTLAGVSASQIGLIMGAFGAATFVIRGLLPRILHAVTIQGVMCAALAVVAVAYALYPLTHLLGVLVVLSVCIGMGVGCAQPLVLTMVHDSSPPERLGEAVGLRIAVSNAVGMAVPLAMGAFATAAGLQPIFWGLAAVCTIAAWTRRPAPGAFFRS